MDTDTLGLFNAYRVRRDGPKVAPSRIGPISLGMKRMGACAMWEIRTLRATWRGLETWHGRDASA